MAQSAFRRRCRCGYGRRHGRAGSRPWRRRDDEYGGSLENRARFGLDVLRAVKSAVSDIAVVYRLSVEDFFPGGLPYSEGRQIAIWAAAAGADALHVTAGHDRSRPSAQVVLPPNSSLRRFSNGAWNCEIR